LVRSGIARSGVQGAAPSSVRRLRGIGMTEFQWPNGAAVAVSLTFDVDGEAGCLGESESYAERLSSLSEARYGVTRGLPRILALLRTHSIPATFYVPGYTAERHPDSVRAIAAAGHDIGHHGYLHLRPNRIDDGEQREEILRGIDALATCVGYPPKGYRSPCWELTPTTLALLTENGFDFDSSCMGDDSPYFETHGQASILELPVDRCLDDWPYFHYYSGTGGFFADADMVLSVWVEELRAAALEHRHITYTMHPEVIGRPFRLRILQRFIEVVLNTTDAWFASHNMVAPIAAAALGR
jgi:peptidoglycan-N-acetylglucosamine deacetylase